MVIRNLFIVMACVLVVLCISVHVAVEYISPDFCQSRRLAMI